MLVGLALESPFTTPTHPYQTFVVLDIAYIMHTLISKNGHRVTQDNVWRHQEWVRVKLPLSGITELDCPFTCPIVTEHTTHSKLLHNRSPTFQTYFSRFNRYIYYTITLNNLDDISAQLTLKAGYRNASSYRLISLAERLLCSRCLCVCGSVRNPDLALHTTVLIRLFSEF